MGGRVQHALLWTEKDIFDFNLISRFESTVLVLYDTGGLIRTVLMSPRRQTSHKDYIDNPPGY